MGLPPPVGQRLVEVPKGLLLDRRGAFGQPRALSGLSQLALANSWSWAGAEARPFPPLAVSLLTSEVDLLQGQVPHIPGIGTVPFENGLLVQCRSRTGSWSGSG